MPSDDDDDAGGRTRPEPQLVRSPPALNRKQARTPLGKTNYFRLQQEEEESKRRAQLEATKEITRELATPSKLRDYSTNSIEFARTLASLNGRAEAGVRGREERDRNKQEIEQFQQSLLHFKTSTMASIKSGTFVPHRDDPNAGPIIFDEQAVAAIDSYAKLGDAYSSKYEYSADGSLVEQRIPGATAALPARVIATNFGTPKEKKNGPFVGGGGGGGNDGRASTAASSPASLSQSRAFGTGGFGSVRSGTALSGSWSTGNLHAGFITHDKHRPATTGGGLGSNSSNNNTTLLTTPHLSKQYPQPRASSQLFADAPNEDPLRFTDRDMITPADLRAAAQRTRAIKSKLISTSPGSMFNNKVFDTTAAVTHASGSPLLARSSSSSSSLTSTLCASPNIAGSGTEVSDRTTSLVRLAQHAYAQNDQSATAVPDLAWDVHAAQRYLPVAHTDAVGGLHPDQCQNWAQADRALRRSQSEARLERIHEHGDMIERRTAADTAQYWSECDAVYDSRHEQRVRHEAYVAKRQEDDWNNLDKQHRKGAGEFHRFASASRGVFPASSLGFAQYMRETRQMSGAPAPAFTPPIELYQSTAFYHEHADRAKLGFDTRLKLASPGPHHQQTDRERPPSGGDAGDHHEHEAGADEHVPLVLPASVADVQKQLKHMQQQQQHQQRQHEAQQQRAAAAASSRAGTPSSHAHSRLFGARSPTPTGLARAATPSLSSSPLSSPTNSASATSYGSAFNYPSRSPNQSPTPMSASGGLRSPSSFGVAHGTAKTAHVMALMQSPSRASLGSFLPFPQNPYVVAYKKPDGPVHSICVPPGAQRIT